MKYRPTERKVYAATLGAGAGTIVSEFVLWGIDSIWWPSDTANVPGPVASFVNLLVPMLLAFGAGWLAKHDPGYTEIDEPPLPPV
jgi:hypothetical protein